MEDGVEDGRGGASRKCPPPRGHLVEHRTEGEQVGPRIDGAAERLLGRHVCDGSDRETGAREKGPRVDSRGVIRRAEGPLVDLRQTEIKDLRRAPVGDEDVARLDVPVDDRPRMGRLEGFEDLTCEIEQALGRHGAPADHLLQGLARQQLHDDEVQPLVLPDVVDRADVRMIQSRGGAGFAAESVQRCGIAPGALGQDFQGHLAAQARVPRPVDLSHAALADATEDLVVPECLSDHTKPFPALRSSETRSFA